MIKKLFVFLCLLLGLSVCSMHVYAQTPASTKSAESETVAEDTKVDYILPYPGILPDHPLYAIKKIRDSIFEYLIVDPIKKTEFYVLQSDKHLNMGVFLSNKGKGALAQTIIAQGEGYMNNAVKILTQLKTQGKEVPGYVLERMDKSMLKHTEVLTELGFTTELETVKALQEEVSRLKQ
jgi:Domain of unknown function (DUF5667)